MRIQSATIGMESAGRYQASRKRQIRFSQTEYDTGRTQNNVYMWGKNVGLEKNDNKVRDVENGKISRNAEEVKAGNVQADAKEEKKTQGEVQKNVNPWEETIGTLKRDRLQVKEYSIDTASQFRYYSTRYIFMLLFGDRGKDMFEETNSFSENNESMQQGNATLEFTPMKKVSFSVEDCYEETENVLYKSKGKVTTADGREISFGLELGMSRSFREYYKEEHNIVELQRVCDPLVINFDSAAAALSDQKFFFDIDADGKKDEISNLSAGSGYLALDKNEDGKINDGSELFGPQSGDGFEDLAEYDEDGNGWIDENDSVWKRLKIWCRSEDGKEELYTLAEKGVGAICLQKAATDFSLADEKNVDKGYIRSTGIFLYENGNVGTIQHLDLAQ